MMGAFLYSADSYQRDMDPFLALALPLTVESASLTGIELFPEWPLKSAAFPDLPLLVTGMEPLLDLLLLVAGMEPLSYLLLLPDAVDDSAFPDLLLSNGRASFPLLLSGIELAVDSFDALDLNTLVAFADLTDSSLNIEHIFSIISK